MYTLITMTRYEGFSVGQFVKYDDALSVAVDVTMNNTETTAVIYNNDGKLIWRAFGNVTAPAPVMGSAPVVTELPTNALYYRITVGPRFEYVAHNADIRKAIQFAEALKLRHKHDYDVWQCDGTGETSMYSTGYRVSVNKGGDYYAADGTLMNADGTRSIFDDVDL